MSRNVTVGKPAGGVGNTGGATEGTVGGGGAVRGSGTTGSGGSNGGGAEGIVDEGGVGSGAGTPGGVVVGCPGSAAGVAGRSRDPRGGAAWASAAHGRKTKSKSTSSGAHLMPLLARGPTLLEEPLGNRDDVVWLQSHVAFGHVSPYRFLLQAVPSYHRHALWCGQVGKPSSLRDGVED